MRARSEDNPTGCPAGGSCDACTRSGHDIRAARRLAGRLRSGASRPSDGLRHGDRAGRTAFEHAEAAEDPLDEGRSPALDRVPLVGGELTVEVAALMDVLLGELSREQDRHVVDEWVVRTASRAAEGGAPRTELPAALRADELARVHRSMGIAA